MTGTPCWSASTSGKSEALDEAGHQHGPGAGQQITHLLIAATGHLVNMTL